MDVRQSEEYANYIKSLGWQVEKLRKTYVFIRKFPLIGSLIKIQRIVPPIPFKEIEKLAQKHRAFQIVIEPAQGEIKGEEKFGYRSYRSPFIPSKTLVKNLLAKEEEIFNSLSKNKRRDVKAAQKNNLSIKEGKVEDFILLKKTYLLGRFILPLGTGRDIKKICRAFEAKKKLLIAYADHQPVAGLILLLHDKTGYYWQAAATKAGKKLLAPTLLLWEAIKLAKKSGCQHFDFEGVADPRFPQQKSWQGFTHFKKGFRGQEIDYPQPLRKTKMLF